MSLLRAVIIFYCCIIYCHGDKLNCPSSSSKPVLLPSLDENETNKHSQLGFNCQHTSTRELTVKAIGDDSYNPVNVSITDINSTWISMFAMFKIADVTDAQIQAFLLDNSTSPNATLDILQPLSYYRVHLTLVDLRPYTKYNLKLYSNDILINESFATKDMDVPDSHVVPDVTKNSTSMMVIFGKFDPTFLSLNVVVKNTLTTKQISLFSDLKSASLQLNDLTPYTSYTFTYHYENRDKVKGTTSSIAYMTDQSQPPKPNVQLVQSYKNKIELLVMQRVFQNGVNLFIFGKYRICSREQKNSSFIHKVFNVTDKIVFNNLKTDMCYEFDIKVKNKCCYSKSFKLNGYTNYDVPHKPSDVRFTVSPADSPLSFPFANGSSVTINGSLVVAWRNNDTRRRLVSGLVQMDVVVQVKAPTTTGDEDHLTPVTLLREDIGLRYTWNNITIPLALVGEYQVSLAVHLKDIHHKWIKGDFSEPLFVQVTPSNPFNKSSSRRGSGVNLTMVVAVGSICAATVVLVLLAALTFTRNFPGLKYHFISNNSDPNEFNMSKLPSNDGYRVNNESAILGDDFSDHVRKLHMHCNHGFSEEYMMIVNLPSVNRMKCVHHDLKENLEKNRYTNIKTFDVSRVILRDKHGKTTGNHNDYINANYVDGYKHQRAYIATQGPLENTFEHFWKMIWQQNSRVIVMLTKLNERGRLKCHQYWPSEGEMQYGHFFVKLRSVNVTAHYTVREFTLKCGNKVTKNLISERPILHYQFTNWPDHGIPSFTYPVLNFVKRVFGKSEVSGAGPTVLHCSAGVGRTGTCIVIDAMLKQLSDCNSISVYDFLCFIRHQRCNLVQTEDQYVFVHDVINDYLNCGDTEVHARSLTNYCEEISSGSGLAGQESPHRGDGGDGERRGAEGGGDDDESSVITKLFMVLVSFKPTEYDPKRASLLCNALKNRPNAILPVDPTLVCLTAKPGIEGSDYINATYFNGYRRLGEFIVTQHPLQSTKDDFWRMVWGQNSRLIVLLHNVEPASPSSSSSSSDTSPHCGYAEEGAVVAGGANDYVNVQDNTKPPRAEEQEEASQYGSEYASNTDFAKFWPSKEETMDGGYFKVTHIESEDCILPFGRAIKFRLQSTQDDYECITQMILVDQEWPNTTNLASNFDLIKEVNNRLKDVDLNPTIIVDRYGGTNAAQFCALKSIYDELCQCPNESVDPFVTMKLFHCQRPGVFKSEEEIFFVYKSLSVAIEESLLEVNAAPNSPSAIRSSVFQSEINSSC